MNWIVKSVTALFTSSIMVLLINQAVKLGMPVSATLMIVFLEAGAAYVVTTYLKTHFATPLTIPAVLFALGAGILSYIANQVQFEAVASAPNPGLPIAILGANSAVVAVLALILFGDKLTLIQVAGVIMTIVGISTIALGKR